MSESKEYRRIKKTYGERFAKLCRELFPQILEEEGKLTQILEESFSNNSRSLGEDIIEGNVVDDFKNYIFQKYDKEREGIKEKKVTKTPYEILDEAGYNLYECETEEDIQSYRKYYTRDETLCTIKTKGRLSTRYCFWAVRKDVDRIKRTNFENPDKLDEYSLSVLAIQFERATGRPEIISRYNHIVPNPNCTLGNDLNKLAPNLEQSFANLLRERGLELTSTNKKNFRIPGYTLANDGKYYKYNMEISGKYYCPGNIIIERGDPKIISDPETGILADYFYIDIKNKKISVCSGIIDSFTKDLQAIERIEVVKSDEENETRMIKVFKFQVEEPIIIGINKYNQIVRYENTNLKNIGNNFLSSSKYLRTLNLPKLEQVGSDFLFSNTDLIMLDLPELRQVGNDFLCFNSSLTVLKLPQLKQVGRRFLFGNKSLTTLELPKLEKAGESFLYSDKYLSILKLPKLKQAGSNFLRCNTKLRTLELPKLEKIGSNFLLCNKGLKKLELPNLNQVGDRFLIDNTELVTLKLPKLERVGNNFLSCNEILTTLELPKLKQVENCFLTKNNGLIELKLPNLEKIGDKFLFNNKVLKTLKLPKLKKAGTDFLVCNSSLTTLKLSSLPKDECKRLIEGMAFLSDNSRTMLLKSIMTDKVIRQTEKVVNIRAINKVANEIIKLKEHIQGRPRE